MKRALRFSFGQDALLVRGLPNITWLIENRPTLDDPWSVVVETRATNYQHWWRGPLRPTNAPSTFYRTREKP